MSNPPTAVGITQEYESLKIRKIRANHINNYTVTDFCNNIDECDENLAEKLEVFNEDLTLYMGYSQRLNRLKEYLNLSIWFYIFTVSVIAGWAGVTQDMFGPKLYSMRQGWSSMFKGSNDFVAFAIFSGTLVGYALIATGICATIAVGAQGSGVPQVKTILAGVPLYKFLDYKVLMAKYLALIFSLGSGFGTGKEGPMIHISTMIAYNLSKVPYYRRIARVPFNLKMFLNAAVACGVASTFGSSFGAICFSIELCSTVFLLSNLWKLYVSATIVKFIFDYAASYSQVTTISAKFVYDNSNKWEYLPHYVIIGIISGWLGSLWIYSFSIFMQYKSHSSIAFLKNRYFFIIMMGLIVSLLQFWVPTAWKGNKGLLNSLWQHDYLDIGDSATFPKGSVWSTLLNSFLTRFIMIMCFATMQLPNGVSLPSITQGAFLGRFYGEILRWYDPAVQVQSFSIVGAAAFAGVMTRTTSVTLLILEQTGKTELILGICIANMFSNAVANVFTMSAFNTALTINKMPYLPFMFKSALYKRNAGEFMKKNLNMDNVCLCEKITLLDLVEFFVVNPEQTKHLKMDEFTPVVEDMKEHKIIGSVRTSFALEYLKKVAESVLKETKESQKEGFLSELVQKFNSEITKHSGSHNHADDAANNCTAIFLKMPTRFIKFLDEIGKAECKYEFNAKDGIYEAPSGYSKDTALRDKFLSAIMLNQLDPTEVKVKDEYYLFLNLILKQMQVDWECPVLKYNSYPICVDVDTKLVKIHYLFQMLGIGAVFVCDMGSYIGKFSLPDFLNLRYSEPTAETSVAKK